MSKLVPFSRFIKDEPLLPVYTNRAKKELNEIKDQIPAHLESFRRWLSSMPHLKCPIDDIFLLAFLRQAKYNHSRAQTRLDNFCTFRNSEKDGAPEWFSDVSKQRDIFKKMFDSKYMSPLGFTSEGVLCVLMRIAQYDFDAVPYDDMCIGSQVWNETLMLDERFQIGGLCFLLDFTGLSRKDVQKTYNPRLSKLQMKYFQEALPVRIKKLIYFNLPSFFEVIFKLSLTWASEKTRSKLMILQDDLTSAYEAVPGLRELMPREYNGDNGTCEEIWEKTSKIWRGITSSFTGIGTSVDESKRPKEQQHLMREYKDLPNDLMGANGTYVKLENEI